MPAPSTLDPLGRFSNRVKDYVRYRPSYPAELIGHLRAHAGLGPASEAADVGAGTGIFTRLLLETGARVFAVEPNDAMRGAAEAELSGHPSLTSVKGTSEQTGLEDGSVDLITCAQSFHWFEPVATRREFRRIARPRAWCALVWNMLAKDDSEFARDFHGISEKYGTDYESVRQRSMEVEASYPSFFGNKNWREHSFGNSQVLDLAGMEGRLLSASYAPKEGHPNHAPMLASLRELFNRWQRDGLVRMNYRTALILGQFEEQAPERV